MSSWAAGPAIEPPAGWLARGPVVGESLGHGDSRLAPLLFTPGQDLMVRSTLKRSVPDLVGATTLKCQVPGARMVTDR